MKSNPAVADYYQRTGRLVSVDGESSKRMKCRQDF